MATAAGPESFPLHVIATAGHVDHGKSTLIVRLTGIDPDRWEEEKRRGLTIDLGFAWCTLPSGREVGFVDVPGHERFVRNMLAGVGPLRLVLFVVAADEGWKPQSEEHLAILDVLGVEGGIVALTKRDLVDAETFRRRETEVRERLAGTALEGAPIMGCSATTGEGLEDLRGALDAMAADAPEPADVDRPRLDVDRSFTIKGAGTVVTGTLTGGPLTVGQEVVVHPTGTKARVRSLQTHQRPVEVARPVSRVAANLVGVAKPDVERGDVLTRPGQWRPTDLLEGRVRLIRGVDHPLTRRGAFKFYAGSAERDARLQLLGTERLGAGEAAFVRLRLSRPVVADVGDPFVLREAGRRETVAGGVVLDPDPPRWPGPDRRERLARRERAAKAELAALIVAERLAVRAADLPVLAGSIPAEVSEATLLGPWWVADPALARVSALLVRLLEDRHRRHPLRPGAEWAEMRRALVAEEPALAPALEQDLSAALLAHLESRGVLARDGNVVRLSGHRVTLGEREEEAGRLVAAVAAGEPKPPAVPDLEGAGFARELIEAACSTGSLVAVGRDLVFTPDFLKRAEATARREAAGHEGVTVSRYRELLGTSRKYALPLLEHFDARGITRRDGDVRRPGPNA